MTRVVVLDSASHIYQPAQPSTVQELISHDVGSHTGVLQPPTCTHQPTRAPDSTAFLTSRLGSSEGDAGYNSVSRGLLARVCLCRHQVSSIASSTWLVKRAELERGRSGAHQPDATVPTLPLFLFPAFKMSLSLSLSLAFSHPPTENYAPIVTTIYQVPTLCNLMPSPIFMTIQ